MKKLPFYLIANVETITNGNAEFQDPLNGYNYEVLDVIEDRDEDGNIKVRVICLETQEDFVTTYDPGYLVIVD